MRSRRVGEAATPEEARQHILFFGLVCRRAQLSGVAPQRAPPTLTDAWERSLLLVLAAGREAAKIGIHERRAMGCGVWAVCV